MTRTAPLAGIAALLAFAGSALTAAPALADGTLTVVVQGRGDVTGSGSTATSPAATARSPPRTRKTATPTEAACRTSLPRSSSTPQPRRHRLRFRSLERLRRRFGTSCDVFLPGHKTVTAVFATTRRRA